MSESKNIVFFQRRFPSANMVLLKGRYPVLVDSGFGGDIERTISLLRDEGVDPHDLQLVINTHYHCDHVGGNHCLQTRFDIPIAAHKWEAAQVNDRDREACSAVWLNQPIEPYTVQTSLTDGMVIDVGDAQYQILHTPGHTLGHISVYDGDGILIGGDTIHDDDVAWLNVFREGAGAVYRMVDTLDKLAKLPLKVIYSGHGAPNTQPQQRIDQALKRYEIWINNPEKIGWHAAKRIVTYAIMLYDGMTYEQLTQYLDRSPWYADYCQFVFDAKPEEFVQPLIAELLRSGAVSLHEGVMIPNAPYSKTDIEWMETIPKPQHW